MLQQQHGPAPAPPQDYDEGYVLPAHWDKPLQELHRHPLDDRLRFYEEPHVYTLDGVPTSASVTAVAHEYERPFVASEAIRLMKTSRTQAWPRREYVESLRPLEEWTHTDGALLVVRGKTVAVVQPHSMAAGAGPQQVRAVLQSCHGSETEQEEDVMEEHAFTRALTDEEISDSWARNGRLASHKGTEAHWLAECFFNGLPHRWWEPEMAIVRDFAERHLQKIVAWNTEKEIVCADADLAGSIDLILWDEERGVHHILDFKRSDKLAAQMRGFGKMLGEMSHLDDCKGAAYALQTSIYQYILERDYGMRIGDRILLSIHPDRPFETSVPYLRAEVDFLMRRRFSLVRARRCAAAEVPWLTCALTGAPCVDACEVTLPDGNVVRAMEKAAQVRGLQHEPDLQMREAFEEAVGVRMGPAEELDRSACASWKRLMPPEGIRPFL